MKLGHNNLKAILLNPHLTQLFAKNVLLPRDWQEREMTPPSFKKGGPNEQTPLFLSEILAKL